MVEGRLAKLSRIGVILSGRYGTTGGMARTALMFCDALLRNDDGLTIVFGANLPRVEALPLIDEAFHSRLIVRDLMWTTETGPDGTPWARPQTLDGYDYLDCDAWVFWHLPMDGVVVPLRPFVVFCADLLSRIVPRAISLKADQTAPEWTGVVNSLLSFRNANLVFCTTPRTLEDVVAFAGVPRSRCVLAPQFAPSGNESDKGVANPVRFEKYFFWTSNDTAHKNHLRAFQMLDLYYSRYPEEALPVVLTGTGTKWFNPENVGSHHNYHHEISGFLAGRDHILRNVFFAETFARPQFIAALKGASFLWHNVIYDNGTAAVLEASEVGVPSLATNYPQMRFFDEQYGTHASFFSAFDVEDGCRALIEMTRRVRGGATLPKRIDYTASNEEFHAWISRLLALIGVAKTNRISDVATADAAFAASPDCARLSGHAARIWPEMARYLRRFPWSDVPVACVIVRGNTEGELTRLIDIFEKVLRQDYFSYKLLVLLPDGGQLEKALTSLLVERALALDFVHAGVGTDEQDLRVALSLADVVFVDHERTGRAAEPFVVLPIAESVDRLALVVLEHLKTVHLPAPSGGTEGPRPPLRSAVDPLFVPAITAPPPVIDFHQGPFEPYLLEGFHAQEQDFRWVRSHAAACLCSGRTPPAKGRELIDTIWQHLHLEPDCRPFFIDLEIESRAIESHTGPLELTLRFDDRIVGTTAVGIGRGRCFFSVPNALIDEGKPDRIEIETNFEYKSGGRESPDTRRIAWKALSFGFGSYSPTMHTWVRCWPKALTKLFLRFHASRQKWSHQWFAHTD